MPRSAIHWRLTKGPAGPALSGAQIEALASTFELKASDLAALNESLGWTLNAFNRPMGAYGPAQSDGRVVFETALRDIRKAAAMLIAAGEQLRRLDTSIPVGVDRYVSPHQTLFFWIATASARANLAADLFEEARQGGMSTALREVKDKRRHSDFRRGMVCGAIIRFWHDLRRNVGYSTDPVSKERTGPLIDFINAVVVCVTDPPTTLSGETIRKEIIEFRWLLELETLMEQAKGIDPEK